MFPNSYLCLENTSYTLENYSLVPIRYEDRIAIMNWRNEQIYHLRQNRKLTIKEQNNYFKNILAPIFHEQKPNQILFSYLEEGVCIGYGGLVHINWLDKNAEISFIMNTNIEKSAFSKHWGIYLNLIEQIAFEELNLYKLFTYAFDLRPHLYSAIEKIGYKQESILKEHCYFDGKFIDVVIHAKFNR